MAVIIGRVGTANITGFFSESQTAAPSFLFVSLKHHHDDDDDFYITRKTHDEWTCVTSSGFEHE
jgi:hypothetical protein